VKGHSVITFKLFDLTNVKKGGGRAGREVRGKGKLKQIKKGGKVCGPYTTPKAKSAA